MVGDIQEWLEDLGLAKYAKAFAENEIDIEVLRHLGENDLRELDLPLGPRKKLLAAIAELGVAKSAQLPVNTRAREAERRQLTVMFCDLVGSTNLSERLDPEDLRKVLRAYQETCAEAVARFDGHVAKYIGDGLLVYFGYPQAHEDDARRAVSAGLGIVEGVDGLKRRLAEDHGVEIDVRVGIHTGLVVAGEMGGGETREADAIVGETPNVAARLEGLAKPNTVVISAATHALVEGLFYCDDLGPQRLKGISQAVGVIRVQGQSTAPSRFDAAADRGLTQLVGREEEVGLLLKRWMQAKDSEGQVVLLSSEAGVGKSRIVRAFRDRLGDEPHSRVVYYGSPYHQNSAFYPATEQLQRTMGFDREDGPEDKLGKLNAVLDGLGLEVAKIAPPLAALLSLPAVSRAQTPELSPQELKAMTMEATIAVFSAMAAEAPVLMVVEDAHWIDPSTIELLSLAIDRLAKARLMLLITFRPEFEPPWAGRYNLTQLALNRLGRKDAAAMVANVTGGKVLPSEVLDQIVAKTDGVPLYVEELTKTMLESGLLKENEDAFTINRPLPPLAIPASLQDSLMARLDHIAPGKEVAQLAAALGRTFSHELLAAISPLDAGELEDALARLVDAQLIYRHGVAPNASYEFKHALVQDAAYQSLLKSTRHQLHARIADTLESKFHGFAKAEPEVLAHHFTMAGDAARAVPYWHRAGQLAGERSGSREAVAHLSKGLELIPQLPDVPERDRQELDLNIILGPALMATKGWAAPEVGAAYERARELAGVVGRPDQLFAVTWGLWVYHEQGARIEVAKALAEELIGLAKQVEDAELMLQAHHASWTTQFSLPRLAACEKHAEQGIALYDRDKHHAHAFVYGGHDPGVCAHAIRSLVLWLLGSPDQAVEEAQNAVAMANELSHPFSQIQAYGIAAYIHQLRREPELARDRASTSIAICEEHRIAPHYLASGRVIRGWANAAAGQREAGIDEIVAGLAAYRETQMALRHSYFHALLADVYSEADRVDDGLKTIDQAIEFNDLSGEQSWVAELHRLRGELLAKTAGPSDAEAEFERSIAIAREQEARGWKLRAATSLARKWKREGRINEARDLLTPTYNWFTEGFGTADLKEAKVLLDELG